AANFAWRLALAMSHSARAAFAEVFGRPAREVAQRGLGVHAHDRWLLAEEPSIAYKDVADIVDVTTRAGMVLPVAWLRPIGVTKG
ncbi:MAG: RtcB family protein, partial [Chloroflexi bacterium]|nr:RtcB family protein [Chloroflexota bacterium]